MEEERLCLSARLALIAALAVLASCSALNVVVLRDPLSAQEHIDLGLSYEQQGKYDLAEKEYRKALDKEPGWAIPYFNLGNLAYLNKDLTAAGRFYEMALARDRANPDIMNNLATVMHEQGRNEQARTLIGQALSIRHRDEYLDTLRMIEESIGKEDPDP